MRRQRRREAPHAECRHQLAGPAAKAEYSRQYSIAIAKQGFRLYRDRPAAGGHAQRNIYAAAVRAAGSRRVAVRKSYYAVTASEHC
eukprot:5740100-Pleurochrysis_carterae.AAC.2